MSRGAGVLRRAWPDHADWNAALGGHFARPEWAELESFVAAERDSAKVYPAAEHVFAAFALTPLAHVRVVLLGQDPYHGPGQAHGLSFSVRAGNLPPPSLRNIFTEVRSCGWQPPAGDLSGWARQGVLLLNTLLTVREGQPLSHRGKGWEWLTGEVLRVVIRDPAPKAFLLWGNSARQHASARRGFLGCRHFQRANQFLETAGRGTVDWGREA
jgi:uracil-DNA glycosylase